jgi:divinyl chlorophyllide a 8-vinyl-reductase
MLTHFECLQMLYKAVGKEPNFFYAPLWLFDTIIDSLQWAADTFKSEKLEDIAELGRIGKYYAVEDMLTTDPAEKFGTITLQEHYNRIAVEGQEYDPYTSMYVQRDSERKGRGCDSFLSNSLLCFFSRRFAKPPTE